MPTLLTSTNIGGVQLKAATIPSTPAAGYGRLWYKATDKTVHLVNDVGTDLDLSAPASGGFAVASQAQYDTLYASSASQWARVANGVTGKVYMATTSGAPTWVDVLSAVPTGLTYTTATRALSLTALYAIPLATDTALGVAASSGLSTHAGLTGTSVHGLGSASTLTASTVGAAFVSLTNPGAITFPRMNADNSVTALSAANFVTAIGASPLAGSSSIVTVGALASGSISSTFGAIDVGADPISGGAINATGTITSNKVGGAIFNSGSTTTGAAYLGIQNTGGDLYWGVESSAGGGILGGTSAYSAVFGSVANKPVQIVSNNAVVASFSSSGLTFGSGGTAITSSADVPRLGTANTFTAFGTHSFNSSGTGGNVLTVRNSTNGAGNYTAVWLGNDVGAANLQMYAFPTSWSTSGYNVALGSTILSAGAGGLSLAASFQDVRIYSRNALAATWGAGQALTLTGALGGISAAFASSNPSVQGSFSGWSPGGGVAHYNGAVAIGDQSIYQGVLQYGIVGANADLYLDNTYDSATIARTVFRMRTAGTPVEALVLMGSGAATFAAGVSATTGGFSGAISIGNTVAAAIAVASTHKVTISIGGNTYYLLASNV